MERRGVLLIAPQPFLQWRGSPLRVGFDARAIAAVGHDVDMLVLPFGEDQPMEGVSIYRVANPFGVKNISIGPSFVKALFDVLLLFKAWRMQGRNRYAVVHCVEDAGLIGVFLAVLYGTKFVFEKHSDPSSYKKGFFRNIVMSLYAAIERVCVRNADAVICTGPGLTRQARNYGSKAHVYDICDIPSSLVEADEAAVKEIRSSWALADGDIVLGYVGSFAVYQGIDLLFDAFACAVKKKSDLRLMIVGGTEEEINDRKEWLREKGCEASVIFQGKVKPEELPSYLKAADILVSPRKSGVNTPLKLLDYLKAGRAVVATDTSANRHILDTENAVFAAPDPEAVSAAILDLAGDRERQRVLGESGRKLIDEKYNFGCFKDMISKVYGDIEHAGD